MPSISSSLSLVYSLIGLLFGYTLWPKYQSQVVCKCDREAEGPILSILQKQLDRCGPEQLRLPVCPDCKIEHSSFARTLELIFVAAASAIAGWFASRGYHQWRYLRRAPRLPCEDLLRCAPRQPSNEVALQQASGDKSPIVKPRAAIANGSRWTPSEGSGVRRIFRPS